MSTLRKRLTRPYRYFAVVILLCAAAAADSSRPPATQITGQIYVSAVRLYQRYGRPLTSRLIHCRYRPTCSEYSLQAVGRLGIRRGLWLTVRRLSSCTTAVRPGTEDP